MSGLYHIGLLVLDMDSAIPEYEKIFGVTFRAPIEVTVARVEQRTGSESPFKCRLTYSTEGPTYIELFEAQGSGLWSPARSRGVHHVGLWTDDPVGESRRLIAQGCAWEATLYLDAATAGIVFVSREGALIELVNEVMRAPLIDWLEGRIAYPG